MVDIWSLLLSETAFLITASCHDDHVNDFGFERHCYCSPLRTISSWCKSSAPSCLQPSNTRLSLQCSQCHQRSHFSLLFLTHRSLLSAHHHQGCSCFSLLHLHRNPSSRKQEVGPVRTSTSLPLKLVGIVKDPVIWAWNILEFLKRSPIWGISLLIPCHR